MQECQKLVWMVVQMPEQHSEVNPNSVSFHQAIHESNAPVLLLRQTYHHPFDQMESLQAAQK